MTSHLIDDAIDTAKHQGKHARKAAAKARRAAHVHDHGGSTMKGVLLGAGLAVAGLMGRKLAMQAPSALAGSWDEALKMEHKATLALIDRLIVVGDDQPAKRTLLLARLKYALGKHAFAEENAVYPALREAGLADQADGLNEDHGHIKQYLYELENVIADGAAFKTKLEGLRGDLNEHMALEETDLFPRLKSQLGEDANKTLTARMNREALKLA
jgi:hemerythrin superfamily protein